MSAVPSPAGGRLALVVDDEPDIRALLVTLLRRDGYDVLEAVDGEEALEVARSQPPDVALMDISMPKVDGFSATRALRSDPATCGVKVVILTASVRDSERAQAMDAGADLYVRKPFRGGDLVRRINDLLGPDDGA